MKTNSQLWMLPLPLVMLAIATVRADEQIFAPARSAEALPQGRNELCQ